MSLESIMHSVVIIAACTHNFLAISNKIHKLIILINT